MATITQSPPKHGLRRSGLREALAGTGEIQPAVFLLAALLPVRGLSSLVPSLSNIPVNTVAAIGLAILGFTRRPEGQLRRPLLALSGVFLVAWLEAVTLASTQLSELRRMGAIAALYLLVWVLSTGRVDLRSVSRGAMTGLLMAIAIGVVLLPVSSYAGRLTGVLGDPNGAGFVIVAIGLACLQWYQPGRQRGILLALLCVGVLLTWSRTTFFALGVAVLWVLLGRRLGRLASLVGLASVTYLYYWANGVMEANGWFVERQGSDDLRERLAIASARLVEEAGWTGHGLGSALVDLGDTTLWFHNSFDVMRAEGGLVAFIALIVLLGLLFLRVHDLPASSRPLWAEGAIIAGLICSTNIGFSLTAPAMAVAIGLYLAHWRRARDSSVTPARGA